MSTNKTPRPTAVAADFSFRKEEEALKTQPKPTPKTGDRMLVKTTHGGTMWDPEQGKFIGPEESTVRQTKWLDIQIAAGKIVEVKE